jgi:hypothetical protein
MSSADDGAAEAEAPVEAHVAELLERAMQALLSDAPDRPVRYLRDFVFLVHSL